MKNKNLLYEIGLTLVKGIGPVITKQIVDNIDDISLLFTEKKHILERLPGLSRRLINEIKNPQVLSRAEQEVAFLEKSKCKALFLTSDEYPRRLKDCPDAPVMLYYKGNADLNALKIISIVGTRNATTYGKDITNKLIKDLKSNYPDILIVSGLAYGIDIAAHQAALKENTTTVAVLAHGLDRIYPALHRSVAIKMLENGGLLTEFTSETNPDRPNFVKRNRIVAGLADCTVVVQSAEKGGALITGDLAISYNRDLFSFPGRIDDGYSKGCNFLIKSRKAALITSAEDIFQEMNWNTKKNPASSVIVQREIFPDVTEEEKEILLTISRNESMQLNTLAIAMNLPISKLSVLLFELEMKGIIRCKPGGMYVLN
ncbi:DNA-processing protein DprA [Bacteroidales bacterium OttesenSCG-928-A17]|nr:DNA-processing protein DprA [Bacteroidales bacterium OttesenSCG-928-A17]